MASRVLCLKNDERFDIEIAQEHGTLKVLFSEEAKLSPFRLTETLGGITERLIDIEFDPHKDLILLTGKTVLLCLFTLAACHLSEKVPLQTLIYDARDGHYKIVALDYNNMERVVQQCR